MRVLVTGGYGFIGSHIVRRFNSEGHEVCVIDNLVTGSRSNVSCKHRFYQINADDGRCADIFRAGKFDVIVHCASADFGAQAQPDSGMANAEIPALMNMLDLGKKHQARQLIYLSSTEVYGVESGQQIPEDRAAAPKTQLGLAKLTGEQYCNAFGSFYGFNVLSLRLSYVYGPMQRADSQFGVVAALARQRIAQNPDVQDDRSIDLIYVEDVADAVYRAAMAELTGTYNLCANSLCSLAGIVQRFPKTNRSMKDGQPAAVNVAGAGCSYDNTRIKRELDWGPAYSLDDGLKRAFAWYRENNRPEYTYKPQKKSSAFQFLRRALPYLQNVLLFGVLLLVSLLFPEVFEDEAIVLLLVYIAIMGITYGSRQSIPSVILSLGLFFFQEVTNGENVITVLYDPAELLNISMIIFAGIFLGSMIDKRNQRQVEHENRLMLLNEKYSFLQEINKENVAIKESLQKQIVNSQDSFGKVFSIINELDSLQPDRILLSAVKAIETIMKQQQVAIYSITQNRLFLRLVASSESGTFKYPRSQKIYAGDPYDHVMREGVVFTNIRLDPEIPFLIAPIRDHNVIIGLIMLYQPDFNEITLHYRNLFSVVAALVSASLSRAIEYSRIAYEDAYVENTMVLNEDCFMKMLTQRTATLEEYNIPYSVLRARIDMNSQYDQANALVNNCRESDLLGLVGSEVHMLLANTNVTDSHKIIERLKNQGFDVSVQAEGIHG